MKDIVKVSGSSGRLSRADIASAFLYHTAVFVCGFIAARASVTDKLLPFGLSLLAGSTLTYTPAAATGAFLGYFFPALGNGGFRYIAALFALLAIKLLTGGIKKLSDNALFLSFITLLASFLTSAVTLGGFGFKFLSVTAESLLAAAGTFFVSRAFKAVRGCRAGPEADELVSLLAVAGILIMGISNVGFNGISLGHIVATALILIAGKYGGILAGTVSGAVVSFALALCGVPGSMAVLYGFVGLAAGVTASFGKYAQAAAPLLIGLTGSVISGDPVIIAETVIEASLGAVLFLLLPRKYGIVLSKVLTVNPKTRADDGCKKDVSMRLNAAAAALSDVSETVEQVAEELSKINAPDFGAVIGAVEQDACGGCKLRIHCWESKRDDTLNAVLKMTNAVKQGEKCPEDAAPEEFKGRCMRIGSVAGAAYRRYSEYASHISAENRIDEVRSVVSDQFGGISQMLSELAGDVDKSAKYDDSTAQIAAAALKNLDIRADECTCCTDKYGRMTISFKFKKDPGLVINRFQVMKLMSVVCERDFDVPALRYSGGYGYATLSEHAAYRVEMGADQKCAAESMMCGDAYRYFYDGKGHFVIILSDGMGTGGRAAVDGAMASGLMSRLIKAGFGYDCSLKILNSSMLFKSTDESLATVDIASIDLFTGKVELYKAGAAPTLVRRQGRTGCAESTSLPAGILREVSFDKAVVKCREGDIVVLMSDGAVSEGTDWIKSEIDRFDRGSAEQLSERICEGAKRRRSDNHEDDITVITAIIRRAD